MTPLIGPRRLILEARRVDSRCRWEVFLSSSDQATSLCSLESSLAWERIEELSAAILKHIRLTNRGGTSPGEQEHFGGACRELHDLLLPSSIQEAIRTSKAIHVVIRPDPWFMSIPWELLHDGEDFLCCKYGLGREPLEFTPRPTARESRPAYRLSFLVVSDPADNLPAAAREGDDIYRMLGAEPKISLQWLNSQVRKHEVLARLGWCDILHYCGHEDRSGQALSEPAWMFTDGPLRPLEIHDCLVGGKAPPLLIFSNSCGGEPIGPIDGIRAMERMSSHARVFLGAGSECYVGTLSDVPDGTGRRFARAFYQRVLEGERIGSALRAARAETRAAGPEGDLSWAPYVLHGDPACSIFSEVISERKARTLVLADADEPTPHPVDERSGNPSRGDLDLDARDLLQNVLGSFPDAAWSSQSEAPFLCAFSRPTDAVRFCCWIHAAARRGEHGIERDSPFRLAVSSGEVVLEHVGGGAAISAAQGPAVDVAGALLPLVRPGQTLMVHSVFDDARAILKDRDFPDAEEMVWLSHGPYRLAGLDDPIWIGEVGERGHAPLSAPAESREARKLASPDEASVLGWRPSLDKSLPNAPEWVLIEKLGEGGFGEVWRIRNSATCERRVAKFCFQSERARHLKREASLIRLLSERLGRHPGIVQVHEVCFETPPFHIVLENVEGLDLAKWFERHGEDPRLTESARLEIVARVAETLQSAHEAGVIHRDVKPGNILIQGTPGVPAELTIRLTDFGIGQVLERECLSSAALTGLTQTFIPSEIRARSGSWLYMAPEVILGQGSSIRSDVYSLGVILHQVLRGEFNQPLPVDWEKDFDDPILAGDIRRCLARNPGDRFESAGELARALRCLPERRAARALEEACLRTEARRRRVMIGLATFSILAALLTLILASAWRVAVRAEERERLTRLEAERGHYHSQIHEAQRAIEDRDLLRAREILYECPEHPRGWEWGRLVYLCNLERRVFSAPDPAISCMDLSRDGRVLAGGGSDGHVRLWDFSSGQLSWEIRPSEARIRDIALNADATRMAIASEGHIAVWDLGSRRRVHRLEVETPPAELLHFAPRGDLLASGDSRGRLRLHDLSGAIPKSVDLGEGEQLRDVAFAVDGGWIFAACHDRALRVYQAASGVLTRVIGEEGQLATSVAVESGGERFAVAFENRICLGSLPEFELQAREKTVPGTVESLSFSTDGAHLAYQTSMGTLGVLDLKTLEEVQTGRGAIGRSIFVTPREKTLLVLERDQRVREHPLTLETEGIPLKGHRDFVSAYAFSDDGRVLATGSDDQTIRLWDTGTGKNLAELETEHPIQCLTFSSKDRRLVAGTHTGWIQVYDVGTGRRTGQIQSGSGNITSIDRHPREDRLAIATEGGALLICHASSLATLRTIEANHGTLYEATYSPDGLSLVTGGGDCALKEWNAETGELVRIYEGHSNAIYQIAFLNGGKRLVSGGEDRRILIWDRETGECMGSMLDKEYSLFDLAVSPDSQRLFTRARLWDLNNLRPILDFRERHRILHRGGLLMAEGGVPTSLRLLPAFPWKDRELSDKANLSVRERVEEYRRHYWEARRESARGER